jgi:hypothetical protein
MKYVVKACLQNYDKHPGVFLPTMASVGGCLAGFTVLTPLFLYTKGINRNCSRRLKLATAAVGVATLLCEAAALFHGSRLLKRLDITDDRLKKFKLQMGGN